MKVELKPGDITLLKVLFSLLIIVVMVRLLIYPGIQKHQDLVLLREETQAKADEMQAMIDSIPDLEQNIVTLKEKRADVSRPYPALLENNEIDTLITGIILHNELFPVSMSIAASTEGVPSAYLNQVLGNTGPNEVEQMRQEVEGSKEQPAEVAPVWVPTPYIYQTKVTLAMTGSEENLRSMLDDIELNYPQISVDSFEANENTYLNTDYEIVNEMSIRCVLTVMTCDIEDDEMETEGE